MKSIRQRCLVLLGLAILLSLNISVSYAGLPSSIPFKPNSEADDNLIYRAIAAFIFAAAVAYGIAWCIKRYMPSFEKKLGRDKVVRSKQLERLESMRLSARSVLVRVRWGDEELLVGENEHGVTLLSKRPLDEKVGAVPVATGTIVAKESHE